MDPTPRKKCPICKSNFRGRTDKKFCSVTCKSVYHKKLIAHTRRATRKIDKVLHRNRSILQELLGKKNDSMKVAKEILDKKKFNFSQVTGYHKNSMNKIVNYVYDFSWIIFSDKNILIKRIRK